MIDEEKQEAVTNCGGDGLGDGLGDDAFKLNAVDVKKFIICLEVVRL